MLAKHSCWNQAEENILEELRESSWSQMGAGHRDMVDLNKKGMNAHHSISDSGQTANAKWQKDPRIIDGRQIGQWKGF